MLLRWLLWNLVIHSNKVFFGLVVVPWVRLGWEEGGTNRAGHSKRGSYIAAMAMVILSPFFVLQSVSPPSHSLPSLSPFPIEMALPHSN